MKRRRRQQVNMSTYSQVPRLARGPKAALCGELGAAPLGGHPYERNHPNNGAHNKWRVLVSIGLLLPALAAIIGEFYCPSFSSRQLGLAIQVCLSSFEAPRGARFDDFRFLTLPRPPPTTIDST